MTKSISFGLKQSVQRLLNRAPNHSVQVPPDPLVVDRDAFDSGIVLSSSAMAASFLSSG
jgi:hypothetical protein